MLLSTRVARMGARSYGQRGQCHLPSLGVALTVTKTNRVKWRWRVPAARIEETAVKSYRGRR